MNIELKKQVIDLSKKAKVELKKKGLDSVKAQVVLVLDISKSMNRLFKSGVMQRVMHVNDIDTIDDSGLYRRLLNEFPDWLKQAQAAGVL